MNPVYPAAVPSRGTVCEFGDIILAIKTADKPPLDIKSMLRSLKEVTHDL